VVEFSAYEKSMIRQALSACSEENLFWRHLEKNWLTGASEGLVIMMRGLLSKIRADIIMPEFARLRYKLIMATMEERHPDIMYWEDTRPGFTMKRHSNQAFSVHMSSLRRDMLS
jgi:hypothetical protein